MEKEANPRISEARIKVIPSVANFITIILANKKIASRCANILEKNNIFIRKLNAYKMDNCLRITIGTKQQNLELLKSFTKFLKSLYDFRRLSKAPNLWD